MSRNLSGVWIVEDTLFAKLEGSQISARMHTGSNVGLVNFVAEQRTSRLLETRGVTWRGCHWRHSQHGIFCKSVGESAASRWPMVKIGHPSRLVLWRPAAGW
jgi:hypothetical protein